MKKLFSILTILCLLCGCGGIEIIDDITPIIQNGQNNHHSSQGQGDDENLQIPEYNGKAYITLGDGIPEFDQEDMEGKAFEEYYELDELIDSVKANPNAFNARLKVDEGDMHNVPLVYDKRYITKALARNKFYHFENHKLTQKLHN